ncbi:MAG: hypothetical protein OXC11_13440, partial [Rhodospirillales bacterium]|nr:hypothetical protein [Rhodospirillales bacterium]
MPTTLDGGLSPRVRGSLSQVRGEHHTFGSIPAGAGKPIARSIGCSAERVYPRGCGEASLNSHANSETGGLSPRVRGSH